MHNNAVAVSPNDARRLTVDLATTRGEIEEAQRLRYRVFADEMGASLHTPSAGADCDLFDDFCDHILVKDVDTGEVVGCTRILTGVQAMRAGGFYASCEFELGNVLRLPGRIMEIGRTCVHPAYRTGSTIAVLWSGLGAYITHNRFDYVIGCASISMKDGGREASIIMTKLRDKYMAPQHLAVKPRLPVPAADVEPSLGARMPPLLKAYLSLGAKVCGEPCWDPDFQVADVFILFDVRNLSPRYARHFLAPNRRPQLQACA